MRTQKEVDEQAKLIEHMLSTVEAHFESKGKTQHPFIESIRDQCDKFSYKLSRKQIEALRNFYERID